MAINVKALLLKKEEEKVKNSKLVLKDVNRDLIVALLGISVYGKEARDEEVLSIIINAGMDNVQDRMQTIRSAYSDTSKDAKIKKDKSGNYRDKDGYLRVIPRC